MSSAEERRRHAEEFRTRDRAARLTRVNADRAARGLPPWKSWRDEFDDPMAIAGLWVLLMVVLSIIDTATGEHVPWPVVLVATITLTVLVVEVIRRTDPNRAADPDGKKG
jgi:hypothetical protein